MDDRGDDDFAACDLVYYQANEQNEIIIDGADLHPAARSADVFGIQLRANGMYSVTMTLQSDLGPLAQLPVSVYFDNILKAQISIQGTEGAVVEKTKEIGRVFGTTHFVKLFYGANGLRIQNLKIVMTEGVDMQE